MSEVTAKPLRLTAVDRDSLRILSACVQDALTRIGEMTYLRRKNQFVLTANRYMWELDDKETGAARDGDLHYRIRTGMHFNGVLGVQSQGVMHENLDGWISLLAIEVEGDEPAEASDPDEDTGNLFLTLVFAAGGRIRLEVECIDCVLTDMDEPWTTRARPDHKLEAADEQHPGSGD